MQQQIRRASRADLDIMIEWAAEEGWNPGLGDAGPFWAADPEGYWVADGEGAPVAAISLARYNESFGFLGFFITRPDHRGRGIGRQLWQQAMSVADRRIVGLDGVVAQQENYSRSGFVYAHANIRYGGIIDVVEPPGADLLEVAPVHMPLLIDYDRRFVPTRREVFLREWLKASDGRRSILLLRDGAVAAYGTIRACRNGFKIGPLFSDTETGADLVFRKLAAGVNGSEVYLDIPEPNASAKALCDRYNLKPVFETARMYRGPDPGLPLARIYGITTFELG
ncbi:GNAT family N-acetyltransferase [Ensifer sp. ENS07]|jgi:GNAT superfamily N-acetyltransferase|uniref:GNAT family N-acetyltransferase n=1 Tax=Ensifer adhaerens TaxID=106592 RepID=A0A9Q8Y8I4_ENSAD|nr:MULTISPECIES: GNAT family N-acetyltransferase [Ensifer]MBD9592197.1 GNAT family N-acetyltransferase [Ensifer sp. ENS05]MBD9635345.1 GNAT family N-acetyltransferase [Ensifer sp. ENS07]USJ24213.1 GNAT family N-acetyltransferase [Ensifer adhaerens]UTV37536.1 GNAT family N-acetyltransferase [Ensifer adhaerens]SDL50765.1 Acetyltransferase (GNAT) domain-containing protein [Ensifer sp. YR511]